MTNCKHTLNNLMTNIGPTVINCFTKHRNVVIKLMNNLLSIGEHFGDQVNGHGHQTDDVHEMVGDQFGEHAWESMINLLFK